MKEQLQLNKNKRIKTMLVFLFSISLLITKQALVKKAVEGSLKLCASAIIPAVFPFMILTDYFLYGFTLSTDSKLTKLFEKAFAINGMGAVPFLIGNICGFPIGAKISSLMKKNGCISENEYQRLIPLCTNPSLAFVISGVGSGIRRSLTDGLILYFSLILSTALTGLIWRSKKTASHFHQELKIDCFSLSESIKNASICCVYVTSYVVFFSIVIGVISIPKLPLVIKLIASSLLEIGNAAYLISQSQELIAFSLPLTAFALGFSGISVYLQAAVFSDAKISSVYFKMKVTEGFLAFLITAITTFILHM